MQSSLTQSAYERLRIAVLACRLPPGEKLVIADLCGRLGVSLGAVREALSRLTSEGLVTSEPQRGFRVAGISNEELEDLTEVRARIECMCLERSIGCGDLAWEAHLLAAYHEVAHTPEREAADPDRLSEAWAEAHARYHAALVAACDSPWLLRLRSILYAQSERYRRLSIPLARESRDLNAEHQAIMRAAIERDAGRAALLLDRHIRATARILLAPKAVDPTETPRRLPRSPAQTL